MSSIQYRARSPAVYECDWCGESAYESEPDGDPVDGMIELRPPAGWQRLLTQDRAILCPNCVKQWLDAIEKESDRVRDAIIAEWKQREGES